MTLIKSGRPLKSSVTGSFKYQGIPIPWTLHTGVLVNVFDEPDRYRIERMDRFIPWEPTTTLKFIGYINK